MYKQTNKQSINQQTTNNKVALLTLLIFGLFILFPVNNFSQNSDSVKSEQSTKQCSGERFVMPSSISVGNEAFANYSKLASLPRDERPTAFGRLTNEQKASFAKVQFALLLGEASEYDERAARFDFGLNFQNLRRFI